MRKCTLTSESYNVVLISGPIHQRQRASVCVCAAGGSKRRRSGKDADSTGKRATPGVPPGAPPPPPTTAPPAAPSRTPLRKQAFRQTRTSAEQRRLEREAREAASAEAQRAQTVWADAESLRQALQQGPSRRQVPLYIIDGYNYLNRDPELAGLGFNQARMELHRRLLRFTANGSAEVMLVYDAMGTGDVGVQSEMLGPHVQAVYTNSCEADTLIIAEAERLRGQFMQNPAKARRVLVVSDDRRIQEACGPTGWVLGPGDGTSNRAYDEVTAVACSYLVDTLQRFERSAGLDAAGGGRRRVSLQDDTVGWARRLLQQVQAQPAQPRPDSSTVLRLQDQEAEKEGADGEARPPPALSDAELEALLDSELSPLSSLDELLEDDISKRFDLDDILT